MTFSGLWGEGPADGENLARIAKALERIADAIEKREPDVPTTYLYTLNDQPVTDYPWGPTE